MLLSEAEAGVACPLSMTYAAVPALRRSPELAAEWERRFLDPDPKTAALCGMAMTERQGGSDVRSNTTRAGPTADEGVFVLTGHKWFCSHPVSEAFLVLAQSSGGLSCFLLPRFLPDGSPNEGFRIVRLKDKLGTRALASAEVEFEGAVASLVGEEGQGVRTIIDMVNHTRLDCVLGSAALMRRAVAEATHHAAHRAAFGKPLIDQPLMQNVLADLCVESEAATRLAMRLAHSYDSDFEPPEFRRMATPVAKYWVCKRTTPLVVEALECLGGNGFVEDSAMPRLLRDSPLNSIWEGSGNVIALDVLRTASKEPETVEAFLAEVGLAGGMDQRLDAAVKKIREVMTDGAADSSSAQYMARGLAERLALVLQASLMLRHSPPEVGDAFLSSRISQASGKAFGILPMGADCPAIIDRHRPKLAA